MKFYTVTRISDRWAETPEGFLVLKDVPIARCGLQLYRHNEVPQLEADAAGWLRIDREPQEVFAADTLLSYEGKPLVNDHPDEPVTPHNWRDLALGHITNVRRGSNSDHDLLFADILVTDARGIQLIRAGKRALSVGYDAAYEQQGPGRGRQTRIVANHVALVDEGRCGARCTILDGAPAFSLDWVEGEDGYEISQGRAVSAPPKLPKVTVHGELELEYRAEEEDTPLYKPRGWNDDVEADGWSRDVDYEPRRAGELEDIDWDEDWDAPDDWNDPDDDDPHRLTGVDARERAGDREWVEGDHPREPGGSGKGGQFTAGAGGGASYHSSSAPYLPPPPKNTRTVGTTNKIAAVVHEGLRQGRSHEEIIAKVREMGARYTHPSVKAYAREVERSLTEHADAERGEREEGERQRAAAEQERQRAWLEQRRADEERVRARQQAALEQERADRERQEAERQRALAEQQRQREAQERQQPPPGEPPDLPKISQFTKFHGAVGDKLRDAALHGWSVNGAAGAKAALQSMLQNRKVHPSVSAYAKKLEKALEGRAAPPPAPPPPSPPQPAQPPPQPPPGPPDGPQLELPPPTGRRQKELHTIASDTSLDANRRAHKLQDAMYGMRGKDRQYGLGLIRAVLQHERERREGPKPKPKGTGPATLEETNAHRLRQGATPGEVDWHKASFRHADQRMRSAMLGVPPLRQVHVDRRDGCYWPSAHEIDMRSRYRSDPSVWRHEFGHAMDGSMDGIGSGYRSSRYEGHRQADAAELLGKRVVPQAERLTEENQTRVIAAVASKVGLKPQDIAKHAGYDRARKQALLDALEHGVTNNLQLANLRPSTTTDGHEAVMLQDFLGAMTHNKIGRGHPDDYYREHRSRHCAEMFANYVALTSAPNGDVYRAILHKTAPRACKGFDDMLDEAAVKGERTMTKAAA